MSHMQPPEMPEPSAETPILDLRRSHLHALQILWEAGEALKPSQIEERFQWPIENATLRSVLMVLVDRGELARERIGKAYYYRPARPKRSALSELAAGLAEVFSGGSKSELLAQLLQDESLSADDLRFLKRAAGKRE